jgi:type IV pilus assembly protein PilM
MRAPRVLAVDIGAGHVACGVFAVGASGRLVLQQFALEPHNSDPAHDARWAVEIAQSLGAVGSRRKLTGPAAIAVPGHLALTKFIKTPSVPKEKRSKIVGFEAAENIPYPLEEVVWDHVVVSDDGFDLEVMLTASKFDAMQSLCSAADAAGFPVERATPACLALYHAFRYNYPQVHDSIIVVNVGARTTTLLFMEGERFYVRTLALAGNTVTQSIAEDLRIDFGSAEMLKIQVLSGKSDLPAASPSRAAVQRAAAAFITKLHLEITRSAVNHRRHSGSGAAVAVYLTGGGSLINELPTALAEKLHLPVERYQSLKNVDLSSDARASGAESTAEVLADLVGLATRLIKKDEAEASLLPPALTAALAFRKRQPVFMAAAALVVLGLIAPIVYLHSVTSATLARVSQVESQLMPLRSVEHRNAGNLRQIEGAAKQITALRGAYETKANWINFLADLQARLVKIEDVWLDKLQVVRPPPPEPGAEPDPAQAAAAEAAQQVAQQPTADGTQPAADPNAAPAPAPVPERPPVKLTLSGRLLDVANPQSKVSPESLQRVKQLLASFTNSQFIAAVENERFDTNQNGLLKFDFTLVINPKKTL